MFINLIKLGMNNDSTKPNGMRLITYYSERYENKGSQYYLHFYDSVMVGTIASKLECTAGLGLVVEWNHIQGSLHKRNQSNHFRSDREKERESTKVLREVGTCPRLIAGKFSGNRLCKTIAMQSQNFLRDRVMEATKSERSGFATKKVSGNPNRV
jgi:hypothetical protein